MDIGGTSSITTLTATATGNTVSYTGGVQTVHAADYYILNLSGSGTKTLGGTTTVAQDLTISAGITLTANQSLTVNGTTTIDGILSFTTNTGTKIFVGPVVVSSTGTWSNATEGFTFRGGITNNGGIFTGGTSGAYLFDTNTQALTGTLAIPTVTVTGVELTNNGTLSVTTSVTLTNGTAASLVNKGAMTIGTSLTVNDGSVTNNASSSITTGTTVAANSGTVSNNGALTVGTNLTGTGTGTLTQGAGATLDIGGTSSITTLTATATGNTVSYTGTAQTVHTGNYYNLTLSGSGAKTLNAATTNIGGNFTLGGTVTTTAVVGMTIVGNVDLGSGTTFTAGAFTHSVNGDWTNGGSAFTSTGTINLNGTAQDIEGSATTTFNNLTLSGGGHQDFCNICYYRWYLGY